MFTVCPKCALTLVVTAADLRVAQGYVRCGRCSNVFNALARLSEDRQAAAARNAAAQPPAPAEAPATSQPAPQPSAPPPAPVTPTSVSPTSSLAERAPPPPEPLDPDSLDEDSIPETALEFNPDATDVTKVFVEPPPNPQWTAATGSFKAIVLADESARAQESAGDEDEDEEEESPASARAPERESPSRGTRAVDRDSSAKTPRPTDRNGSGKAQPAPDRDVPARNARVSERDNSATNSRERHNEPDESHVDVEIDPEMLVASAAARDSLRRRDPTALRVDGVSTDDPVELTSIGRVATAQPKPTPATARSKPTAQEAKPARRVAQPEASARFAPEASAAERFAPLSRSRGTPSEFSTEPRSESRLAPLWSIGTGALVIILIAQLVHHYRNELAANPQLNRPLSALYAALGIPLIPRWDLHAYDVHQLGASVDSATAGQITVRASVKNSARQAQPMPLLRVTLQDRFGNRIAARDVPPQSYLPRAIPPSSYLSAGQRIDAEMAFVDPGSNAVGFEIDACLPAAAGGIICANDPGAR